MKKTSHSNNGADIEVPSTPDFSRLPTRPSEMAVYREDGPPRAADNPLYLAIPGPRSVPEVRALMESANPVFDPTVRSLPPHIRKERVDDVDSVLFSVRQHVALEEMVMTTIRNAFSSRPWNNLYVQQAAALANSIGSSCDTPPTLGRGSVGSGSVFGGVGRGKTVSLIKILMGSPQTIKHAVFKGRRLGITQIAWLYLSMPPKASSFGLLVWIASVLDYILGTNYRGEVENAKNHTDRTRIVASKLAIHAVGVIFCDELQNIKVGSKTERELLENTLQELINYTHTRWVFVGTNDARTSIKSEALLRRMIGERGQINWASLSPGSEWDEFLTNLWSWQVTSKATELTPKISATMHRLTGGVADYAKKLFTAAQVNVIGNSKHPDEQLTEEVLLKTMRGSFGELHVRLEREFHRKAAVEKARASREVRESKKSKPESGSKQ
jgi:hypothetical protein